MGYRTVPPERLAELTALSVFVAETANLQPDAWAPYVGHNAFAHKGGMHQQGVNADARAYEHIDPATVGNERRVLVSELSGRGTILAKARELGVDLSDDAERVPAILARLKELEHEGYHFEVGRRLVRAAARARDRRLRAAVHPRELPRHHREARRRAAWRPRRRSSSSTAASASWPPRRATARSTRSTRALRLALEPRVPELATISLVNFKVRILDETKGTGAVTRVLIDSGDGRDTWGAIGVSENIIEASWEALLDSLEHGVRRSRGRRPPPPRGLTPADERIPLAKPVIGERERELVDEVLRSGQLSLGPMGPRFERAWAERIGVRHAVAVSSGTAGLHLCLHALGIGPGDEVVTSSFSFVASANAVLFTGATPVFAEVDPLTFNMDPAAVEAAITPAHEGDPDRRHLRLPGRGAGAGGDRRAPRARPRRGRLPDHRRRLRRPQARHVRPPGRLRLLRQQAAHDRRGRHRPDRRRRARPRPVEPAQPGPLDDGAWLVHSRLGFNYRLSDVHCAIGVAQLERLDEMMAGRERVAGWYQERVREIGRRHADVRGPQRRSWFVYAPRLDPDLARDQVIGDLDALGVSAKPYLPCIHLQPYYQRRPTGTGPASSR